MSLIEIIIAMLILMVVSMALLQTGLLGVQENLRNSLREEAVRIADQRIGDLRGRAYYSQISFDPMLNSGFTTTTVTRYLRSFQKDFTVDTNIDDVNTTFTSNKLVSVKVSWSHKGTLYDHTTTVMLGKK
jgi:type IV pilus assembly protein PilV